MRLRLSKEGLTLVELLLVIGIIALLIGIAWLVIAPIKRKALLLVCQNNLRQIHLAIHLYRQDYQIDAPSQLPIPSIFARLYWGGYVRKDSEFLHCPIGRKLLEDAFSRIGGKALNSYIYPATLPPDDIVKHFRKCIELKQDEVAILCDPWHNPNWDFYPRWELILRFNGKIDWMQVEDGMSCR